MKRILSFVLAVCALLMSVHATFARNVEDHVADGGQAIVAAAYAHILDDYYRPVAPQTVVGGARAAILRLLRGRGVDDPDVTAAFAVGDRVRDIALVNDMVSAAAAAYPRSATRDDLREAAISGMADALGDRYSHYYSPDVMKSVAVSLSGVYGGLGMSIRRDDTGRVLASPSAGGAAEAAGVRSGDVIEAIDGTPTAARTIDELAGAIRGLPDTTVALQIRRDGASKPITVIAARRLVEPHHVQSRTLGDLEHIRVSAFARNVAGDVRRALAEAVRNGARGCIVDMRNNSGGLTSAAVGLTSLFLSGGNVYTTISRSGVREAYPIEGRAIYAGPLVVLVNRQTRSAAEITAGALQDAGRATLVGTTTFGKGVSQHVITLADESGLVLTQWRYVLRNGRDIDHVGVIPDILVEQPEDEAAFATPDDRQLAEAEATIMRKSVKQK